MTAAMPNTLLSCHVGTTCVRIEHMENTTVRKGRPEDAQDFARLVLFSAPTLLPILFAPNPERLMRALFLQPGNLFSFEHSCFIEASSKIAGMLLGYSWTQKKRENLHTGAMLVKHLKWRLFTRAPHFLRAENAIGKIEKYEYYVSNIAVYPEFSGLGLGTRLLSEIELEARKTGSHRIVLDVETANERALRLYERLGYTTQRKTPAFKINKEPFGFFRMSKILI